MKVVYYSLTGNTKAFADRFADSISIEQAEGITEPYVLFTPTYNFGEVPQPVREFLDTNEAYLRGVVAFGNRNWGAKFAQAGDIIAEEYNVPLLRKVEMRGADGDFAGVKAKLTENAKEEREMSYCDDCVDGGNVLSWLDEKGNVQTQYEECKTCNGAGWIDDLLRCE